MDDKDKYCRNCRFFDDGRCRRYPPVVAQVGEAGRAKWVQHLPMVNEGDFCGEFQQGAGKAANKSAFRTEAHYFKNPPSSSTVPFQSAESTNQ